MSNDVRVRFPPSPTGYCHVGTARMAIVNYLFAKKHNGTIYFRSEDTDKERSKREYEDDIKEQLEWLGLSWDDFSRSTELVGRHTAAMQKLVDEDKAYLSEEESKKEPGVKTTVVRMRNPGTVVRFNDVIRGEISFDTTELRDFVIGRSIEDPLYNFAVVVDDAAQGITHVIRGEDHISNTPRQILIQEALGYTRPVYAHYPLHLGSDRSKLSKRTGDVAVRSYREKGYLSEALLNYIALLGWTPPSEKELMSLEEMIAEFELEDLHKSGAIFDMEKLRWFNRQYLMRIPENDFREKSDAILMKIFTERSVPWNQEIATKISALIKERISVYEDIETLAKDGEFDFFFKDPVLDAARIPNKGNQASDARKHLEFIYSVLEKILADDFTSTESIKNAVWGYAEEQGRGAVLWPLRYAISGRDKSPDPFVIASIIGKDSTLQRIKSALQLLQ